ncbi:uncharacterized protein At2g39795, mitochondrial-like [Argentina anserina]|uniref:uncharacterized protein At2g39795, mitochondrial-like n=1 Tax=Argentina anserina TaxID=57926 RepID=UPI00217679FA|nr:uncharacterized protein At2g39795, mitochondrial-like [Potentilla anserina]
MEKMISLSCSSDLKMALFTSGSHKPPSYSSSIVSFSFRAIRSARSFANRREVNRTNPSPASPKMRATQDLIKGLKSEITTVQEDLEIFRAVEGTYEFPFEIVTRLGCGLKTTETELKRELDDEIIRVSVEYDTDEEDDDDEDEYEDEDEDEEDYDEEQDEEDDDDKEGAEDDDDDDEDSGIPMKVSISQKTTGQQLELDVTAFPDEICVDKFSIKKPEHSNRDLTKTGSQYLANLQKELVKYLEVKGVTPNTIELWKANLKNKEDRESLTNMQDLRAFVEQSTISTGAS